jgi:hypothetical protein
VLFFTEDSKELLPRYIKTSKGLILPREIYYTPSSIDRTEKEIRAVKKRSLN